MSNRRLKNYTLRIGKNTIPTNSYLLITLTPKNPDANYEGVDVGFDLLNEEGAFKNKSMLPNIWFFKRNSKGFVGEIGWNDMPPTVPYSATTAGNLYFDIKYENKGAIYDNESKSKNETYTKLRECFDDLWANKIDDLSFMSVWVPFDIDFYVVGDGHNVVPYDPDSSYGDITFRWLKGDWEENYEYVLSEEEEEESFQPEEFEPPPDDTVLYASYQEGVCVQPEENSEFVQSGYVEPLKVCPTCIPNPLFNPPSWLDFDVPWLNEATCEVTYKIVVDEPYENFTTGQTNRESYIRRGIVEVLNHYNKVVSEQDICSTPPESSLEECAPRLSQDVINSYKQVYTIPTGENDGSTFTVYAMNQSILTDHNIKNPYALELYSEIKEIAAGESVLPYVNVLEGHTLLKLVIPANLINLIPTDNLAKLSDLKQDNLQEADEVVFKAEELRNIFKRRLPKLFRTYETYQAIYWQTQGGRVKINASFDPNETITKPYFFKNYESKFEDFYNKLFDLLENNDYKIYAKEFSFKTDFKLKSKYSGDASIGIGSAQTKYKETDEVKIIFDGDSDSDNPFKIKAVYAKYYGCPWVKLTIGSNRFISIFNNQPTLMGYINNTNTIVQKMDLKKGELIPWRDFLVDYTSPSITFVEKSDADSDAESCISSNDRVLNDLVLDLSVSFSDAIEYALNSLNCRDFQNYDKSVYTDFFNGDDDSFFSDFNTGALKGIGSDLAESSGYNKAVSGYKESYQKIFGKDTAARKFFAKLTSEENAEKGFFEKISGKTIDQAIENLRQDGAKREFIGDLLQKLNPCNWEDITFEILKCLLKGLNPTEALYAAARSLLGSLDPGAWESLLAGLPIQMQLEIKDKVEKKFQGLPSPWEFKKQQMAKGFKPSNQYQVERDPPQNPKELIGESAPTDEQKEALEDYSKKKEQIATVRNSLSLFESSVEVNRIEFQDFTAMAAEYDAQVSVPFFDALAAYGAGDIDEKPESQKFEESYYNNFLNNSFQKYSGVARSVFAERIGLVYTNSISNKDKVKNYKTFLQQKMTFIGDQVTVYNNQIEGLLEARDKISADILKDLQDGKFRNDVNVYEKAIQAAMKIIIEAYIEATIESLPIDDLRNLINSIPGSEILGLIVATAACPNPTIIDEFLDELVGGIEFNPCFGKYDWDFPDIPTLPGFSFLEVLKYLVNMFLNTLLKKVFEAITKYLLKVLLKIKSRVCDILAGIGLSIAKPDEFDLLDAIAIAFCNSDTFQNNLDTRGKASNTLVDVIDRYTGQQSELSEDDILDWMERVSQNISAKQFLKIFIEGPSSSNQEILNYIWEVTQGTEIEQQGILTSVEDIEQLFALMSGYLTDTEKLDFSEILENISETLESETYDEFCVRTYCTEIGSTYRYEAGVLPDGGALFEDVRDLFESWLEGPFEGFSDIYEDIFLDPGGDQYCEDAVQSLGSSLTPGNMSGKKGIRSKYSPEMKQFSKALADSVFSSLDMSFIEDMIGKRQSLFNGLLADSDNALLTTTFGHEYRVQRRFLFSNAHHSVTQQRQKYDDGGALIKATMWLNHSIRNIFDTDGISFLEAIRNFFNTDGYPDATYTYPNSVGLWMLRNIHEQRSNIVYDTKMYLITRGSSSFIRKEWKSLGFISDNVIIFTSSEQKPDLTLTFQGYNGEDESNYNLDVNYSSHHIDTNIVYGSYEQYYGLQAVERTKVSPSLWDRARFFALYGLTNFGPNVQNINTVLDIKVPILVENHLNMYEKYKPELETIDAPNNQSSYETEQEICFRNFLKDNDFIEKFENMGYIEEDVFKQILPSTTYRGKEDVVLSDSINVGENTLFDRLKDSFSKEFLKSILGGAQDLNYIFSNEFTVLNSIPSIFIPNSFRFGYEKKSALQYEDLLYVNPEASPIDPSTWYYDKLESEKILGKSATENPRVVFLDPDIYGGRFRRPKVYVNPYPYKGWLGLMQAMLPEDDACAPVRSNWLFLNELAEHVSKLENNLTRDKRLEYDLSCVEKPPFDLIADVSTHAYLDGIVTVTLRAYLIEFILKTLPVTGNLKYSSLNFDGGLGSFFLYKIKEELEDYPTEKSGGIISRRRYWYLFLEQMVQTVERRVLTGDIVSDEALESDFAKIKTAKENYDYPSELVYDVFKTITYVTWSSIGIPESAIFERLSDSVELNLDEYPIIKDCIDSVAFCGFGENFRQYLKGKTLQFKPKRNTIENLRLYTKIYAIYKNEEVAERIASRLILKEFDFYQQKLQKQLRLSPAIHNISKFILNPLSGLTVGPSLNIGTTQGETAPSLQLPGFGSGATMNPYGDVIDVVEDYKSENPIDNLSPYISDLQASRIKALGSFYIEKFVIVKPKIFSYSSDEPNVLADYMREYFGPLYSGKPIPVQKFKLVWEDMIAVYPEAKNYNISDFFGNLKISQGELLGYLGIQFGVRLSYIPPEGFELFSDRAVANPETTSGTTTSSSGITYSTSVTTYREATSEEIISNIGDTNKIRVNYYGVEPSDERFSGTSYQTPIPVAEFYEDIKDQKISESVGLDIDKDLKCYIDKMCSTEEYKFFMDYIFNIKSIPNIASVYSYYAFFESIGMDPTERSEDPILNPKDMWKSKILKQTKTKSYELFKKFYMFENVLNKEEDSDSKHKKDFKSFNMPRINLNLNLSVRWWQRRLFYDRPFDGEDKECLDSALDSFNQHDSRKNQPLSNANNFGFVDETSNVDESLNLAANIDIDAYNSLKEAVTSNIADKSYYDSVLAPLYNDLLAVDIVNVATETGISSPASVAKNTMDWMNDWNSTIRGRMRSVFKPSNDYKSVSDAIAKTDFGSSTIALKYDMVDSVMTYYNDLTLQASSMTKQIGTLEEYLQEKENVQNQLMGHHDVSGVVTMNSSNQSEFQVLEVEEKNMNDTQLSMQQNLMKGIKL